jgi:catechol 2,3-dioxygenase-like lactoylglutathione lyase family enzyme
MSSPQLDVIGIVVADMAASLAFYRRLGLAVPAEADNQPHAEATLAGDIRIAWDTLQEIRSFDPDFEKPEGSGISLAFRLESPAAVDATYDELVSAGYRGKKAPWDAFWGQRYALIRDPDGYDVSLFAPLAGDRR